MKYSNQVRRKRRNIPCKECLVLPICMNKGTTTINCSTLYFYAGRFIYTHQKSYWKQIYQMFQKPIIYITQDYVEK
jgi:hypothetical protein